MSRILVAPLYKGLVHADDSDSMALITRRSVSTGQEIPLDQYVNLVAASRDTYPELTQDIVRATTAALLAQSYRRQSDHALLASVEGCEQTVGGVTMTGSAIMESIWKNVVPHELMRELPLHIEPISRCTIEEIRALFAIPDVSEVHGITHHYHAERTEKMLCEEVPENMGITVATPEELVVRHTSFHPHSKFVWDLAVAGAPSKSFTAKEEAMEMIYGPLHELSRVGEKITHRAFNLEIALADWMRKRAEKSHSKSSTRE